MFYALTAENIPPESPKSYSSEVDKQVDTH